MPTLQFLLLGHPHMKPKAVQELEDGTQILQIPRDFQVSQKVFLHLINCIFETKPIPARGTEEMESLEECVTILGGCEVLEERLKEQHTNPLNPEEDINDDYLWQVLHISRSEDIRMPDLERLANAGFSYRSTTEVGIMATHLFRKKKE